MDLDTKLKYAVMLEVFSAVFVLSLALSLPEQLAARFRLWEIFPAFLAAAITTYGLKAMKKKT